MASGRIARGFAITAFVGASLLAAPGALAAPLPPPPPGPPPGYWGGDPYSFMPGRIGHQPGADTYTLGFWMRPRRGIDSAGIGAMSNTDSKSAGYGMPGDQLGVEPRRALNPMPGPGVRPQNLMEQAGVPDLVGGLQDSKGQPSKRMVPAGEPLQPQPDAAVGPSTADRGVDAQPHAR